MLNYIRKQTTVGLLMSHLTLSGAWDENPTLSSLLVKSKCSRLFGDFLFGELNIKKKQKKY